MNLLQSIPNAVASPAVVHNVGWLLVHSLWQCLLVAFLAMSLAKMMQRQSSSARYWMYSMALSLMVVAPVVTMVSSPQAEVLIPASDQRVESGSVESVGREQRIVGGNGDGIPLVVATAESHSTVSESREEKPGSEPGQASLALSTSSWIKAMLTQRWNGLTSGEIDFEVVSEDPGAARTHTRIIPAWLRFCPGTQIVEHTDAQFVSGVVVDEDGRPIAGCSVEHPGLVNSKTDDQGKFQYKQSVPHRTVLRAYHPEYRLWHGAPELGDVIRIVLHRKRKVEAVNGTREMTVRVIDSRTADPVPNVKVTARQYEGPRNGTVAATAVTNQDGTVVMRGLDFIQHRLSLSADRPVSYIGTLAHPGAEEHEVVMLVNRACELVLRAVDSETGMGIAGVRFDRERALAELWAEPVVSDILGSEKNRETLTDDVGYARFLVGPAKWSYMILKAPNGYDAIVPIDGRQEVEIETPVGGKVEYTFRLVKNHVKPAAGKRSDWQERAVRFVKIESRSVLDQHLDRPRTSAIRRALEYDRRTLAQARPNLDCLALQERSAQTLRIVRTRLNPLM